MSRNHVSRLHSGRWARVKRAVHVRDGYRCRNCGRAGRLECDHIKPDSGLDPFDMDNLQSLCRGCHVAKTRGENSRPVSAEQREWQHLVLRGNLS